MGWITWRDPPRRIFEDGVRWVEAIKSRCADAEEFACWAIELLLNLFSAAASRLCC